MWPLKRPKIQHPTFGSLHPCRHGHFWCGKILFEPTGEKIRIAIQAGKTGPTGDQEKLYKLILSKYEAILPKLCDALLHEYQRVKKANPDTHWPRATKDDLLKIIPLGGIWLEEGAGHPFLLSFQSERDKNHEFHCRFHHGKLKGVAFEH